MTRNVVLDLLEGSLGFDLFHMRIIGTQTTSLFSFVLCFLFKLHFLIQACITCGDVFMVSLLWTRPRIAYILDSCQSVIDSNTLVMFTLVIYYTLILLPFEKILVLSFCRFDDSFPN